LVSQGQLYGAVSKVFQIAWAAVTKISVYQHVHSTAHCSPKSEIPKITTTTNGKIIKHLSQKDPKHTVIEIIAEIKENYSVNQRISTTKQCLNDAGLHGRCPEIKSFISTKNWKAQLHFANKQKCWACKEQASVED
jgi:hypothetical protein